MTPAELARIRAFLARIRVIAEDFHQVFYNRLIAQAPDLRLHYLTPMCDGGAGLCFVIERLAETVGDQEAMHKALVSFRGLSGARSHRVHELSGQAFLWTAERCMGADFTDEDRAAFVSLHHAITRALEELHGPALSERVLRHPWRMGSGPDRHISF